MNVERDLELNVATPENDPNTVWKSCCFDIDKEAVVYFTVYVLIVIVVLFCFYQLIQLQDCHAQQAYLGVLTMILGILLPQPKISKRR